MLRASACHNYSPEPPGDAAVPAEPRVPGSSLAEKGPPCRGIVGSEAGSRGFAASWGPLGDLSPTSLRWVTPTANARLTPAAARGRLDDDSMLTDKEALAPRSPLHCAVPPAQRFAHANHLGLNLCERRHGGEPSAITM
ncbi:hypothetical protein GCM10010383_17440 [Streptomyces lomondensis]|uniref:Uncharacterized protein n=1 Tax=Streptomyces lomondensis TaxID=68229 RepID=A0ABQ2X062_9ACTN|nr:hypothetical protein GCM10010383_17440 [Streptomyces lomondensis]